MNNHDSLIESFEEIDSYLNGFLDDGTTPSFDLATSLSSIYHTKTNSNIYNNASFVFILKWKEFDTIWNKRV